MRTQTLAPLVTLALLLSACASGGDASPEPPTTAPTASTPAPTPASPPAAAMCEQSGVLDRIDTAVAAARLAPATWSAPIADTRFSARTVTGEEYARRLGLDCGLRAAAVVGDDERLLVAAWTGSRVAWVVQTTETPATPYAAEATVDVLVAVTTGEWLDDDQTVWAGTSADGDTFVIGHVGYSLGAAAKDWLVHDEPSDEPTPDDGLLAAERHAIEVLGAAGMREVGIAEPAQIGSEEGHVQFVSPTGQVSVADVAPTGWFDPMLPRYYDGPTRTLTVDGADVRVTEPGPDAPSWAIGAELGFACSEHVWLLQPPLNGDVDEQLATAGAVLATDACRAR